MRYSELKSTLKKHDLRVTDCRMDVLEVFLDSNHALSSRILEEKLSGYDRVTLYRTLHSFIKKGVLHKIPDDSGVAKYGMCFDTCTPEEHNHDHVHFKCQSCGNVDCLPTYNVPKVEIPGYQVFGANLIINGLCLKCREN